LHDVLFEASKDPSVATKYLTQSIYILKRMIAEQDLPLKVPDRVAPASIQFVVDEFLSEGSGGDRAVAVTVAIFKELLGPLLGIARVDREVVNAADASTQSVADVMCYDSEGCLLLAVEVKERSLSYEDVRSAFGKLKQTQLGRLVFAAPLIERVDSSKIREFAESGFQKENRSLHHVTVNGLLSTSLVMTKEHDHVTFLRGVDTTLTKYNTQPANRQVWRDLVNDNC
jgi:hypothetical protein